MRKKKTERTSAKELDESARDGGVLDLLHGDLALVHDEFVGRWETFNGACARDMFTCNGEH